MCVWLHWQSQLGYQGDYVRVSVVTISILLCKTFYQYNITSDTLYCGLSYPFPETEHLSMCLIIILNLLFSKKKSILVSFSLPRWIAVDCPFLMSLFIHE